MDVSEGDEVEIDKLSTDDKQAKEEDAVMALLQMGEQIEPSHKYIDKDQVRLIY